MNEFYFSFIKQNLEFLDFHLAHVISRKILIFSSGLF